MRKVLLLIVGILFSLQVHAQQSALAQQYYKNGEYEKAAQLFKQLYEKNSNNYYIKKYVESIIELERYDEALTAIEKQLKKQGNPDLYILKGSVLEMQGKEEAAQKVYRNAINNLDNSKVAVIRLGNAFKGKSKNDLAIETYEKGAKMLNDERSFAYQLGQLYRQTGDTRNMIRQYLISLEDAPQRLNTIKIYLDRYLDKEQLGVVQEEIYNRISEGADNPIYPELLSWVALQREDYMTSLIQMRSVDQKLNENGQRVYEIGKIAQNSGDYNVATQAYNYIINQKGRQSTYYIPAVTALLNTKKAQITESDNFSDEELLEVDQQYEDFLEKIGINSVTSSVLLNQAEFNIKYLDNTEKAKRILESIIDMSTANKYVKARAKLMLAENHLLNGERWDATLLYSQVDKSFPEEEIGEMARYKNALLSYYVGDFVWAKQQFDILKRATSRLISNDAIDMSVFIADNLNLDTTARPIQMYADAELLLVQNKYRNAISKLDSLMTEFPEHNLKDDIYYLKGKIYEEKGNFDKAIEMFSYVKDNYPEEIRADNSIFRLAKIYESKTDNTPKAIKLYELLYTKYKSSTFSIDARKRYRELIGDDIQ